MYNQFMLQRNIDKLYPRKRQYKPGLLMQSSLVRARLVCRLLVQITKTKQGYRTTTVVTSLCTFWISGSQVNDINIPIGGKHCGQDLTREYAGKAQRGVPRLRYENYNFAHVVVTGEYRRVDALPNPRIETQSPLWNSQLAHRTIVSHPYLS